MTRPPVAILCGGLGTRLYDGPAHPGPARPGVPGSAQEVPKPLFEVGGMPIMWHVVQLYAAQGFSRFLLATGHRAEQIERFAAAAAWPSGVSVECVDTGVETMTGGRLRRLAPQLESEPSFCATYADGLADIDLGRLLDFHAAHGALASMTVVRPELQFGVTEISADDVVSGFREKPRSEHWINGGFFCFATEALERMGPDSVLEREPLEGLARDGELRAYRHDGFWACMDTYKDAVALNELWSSGQAPWRPRAALRPAAGLRAGGL